MEKITLDLPRKNLRINTLKELHKEFMKKISLLLLSTLMALCLFTACGDDDEDQDIVGKWQWKSDEVTYVKTSSAEADALIVDYMKAEREEDYDYDITEFTADGKMYEDGEYLGTYTVSGNKLTVQYSETNKYEVEFSIKGDDLFVWKDWTKEAKDEREDIGIADDVEIEKVTVKSSFKKR